MKEEYFTLEQADKVVEQIKNDLLQVRTLKREIESIVAGYNYDMVLLAQDKPLIDKTALSLQEAIDRVIVTGALLRDLDVGIVFFLSFFNGKEIYYIYVAGQERIGYWTTRDGAGYHDRQPIVNLDEFTQTTLVGERHDC